MELVDCAAQMHLHLAVGPGTVRLLFRTVAFAVGVEDVAVELLHCVQLLEVSLSRHSSGSLWAWGSSRALRAFRALMAGFTGKTGLFGDVLDQADHVGEVADEVGEVGSDLGLAPRGAVHLVLLSPVLPIPAGQGELEVIRVPRESNDCDQEDDSKRERHSNRATAEGLVVSRRGGRYGLKGRRVRRQELVF
jgi:hypothetical protein